MLSVSKFMPRLMPLVIGAPEPLAQQALVDSAVAFCERSLVLAQTLDPVTTRAGVDTYDFNLPGGQAVATVLRAWFNGDPIYALPTHAAPHMALTEGVPRFFYGWDTDEGFAVKLRPVPNGAGELVIRVALKPARGAAQLHQALFNDWIEPIVDGAAARLKSIPDQQYTDFAVAAALLIKARAAANAARVDGMYGKSQAQASVTMRPFA